MRFKQPSKLQRKLWNQWIEERPASIQEVARRFDPWTLYRLKTTGQRVYILSFSEPGEDGKVRCRVGVSGEFNLVTFERDVTGIDPDDLVECDLPGPNETVGTFDLPIEVLVDLRERYPANVPAETMAELIKKYPLKDRRKES